MKYSAIVLCFMLGAMHLNAQDIGDWKMKQLITVESLLKKMNDETKKENLIILNTGPVEDIKGAINIGPVENEKYLNKLATVLDTIPKKKELVIYCGCCPLAVCPNLKPAYDMLKKRKYKNFHVLLLAQDLQEDWIDKGYPVE